MSVPLDRKVRKIKIQNFQSHEYSEVILSDGLNILSGTNNAGKSAVARAISWVMYCESGTSHIRTDAKECSVEIEFNNGDVIKRTRKGDHNFIQFKNSTDKEFTTYKSFGNKYPKVVRDFLQNPPEYDKFDPLAYSGQTNKNFLIDIKPSALPEIISCLVGTDDLDIAAKNVNTSINQIKTKITGVEEEIEKDKLKLEEDYNTLDEQIKIFEDLKTLNKSIKDKEKLISNMVVLLNSYNEIKKDSKIIRQEISDNQKIIDLLENRILDIQNKTKNLILISNTNNEYETTSLEIKTTESFIGKLKNILSDSLKDKIKSISSNIDLITTMNSHVSNINAAYLLYTNAKADCNVAKNNYDDILSEYNELISFIKENNLVCEKCNKIGGVSI
jgi:DNA repair exonuclease SbcCD ATPase subunit